VLRVASSGGRVGAGRPLGRLRRAGISARRRATVLAFAVAVPALVACSWSSSKTFEYDDGPDHDLSAAAPFLSDAAECGAFGREPCDVLDPTCQSELAAIAACQWGGKGTEVTLPPITTLTRAEVLGRFEMLATVAPPAAVQAALDRVLELLGLQPAGGDAPTSTELAASLVLAFYEFGSDQATLVSDASTGDARIDDALLFHELVHAQQDARYDIGAQLGRVRSTDSYVALRGLFEGEAEFHQLLFELEMSGTPSDPATVKQRLDAFRDFQEPALFAEPDAAWARSLLLAAYIYGPYTSLEAWSEGGPSAMQELYDNPPTQSLRLLETAFGRARATGTVQPFPSANIFFSPGTPKPVEGDEAYPLATDRLGAWTIYVLARLAGDATQALEFALGWRGDQLDVFRLADGGAAGRYRVFFDTSVHANDFAGQLSANPNMAIRTNGPMAVVTVSTGARPEWLFGPLAMP
jgi:hypothetical protein